ncbi:unnamed protein product [Urochloa humidicola]
MAAAAAGSARPLSSPWRAPRQGPRGGSLEATGSGSNSGQRRASPLSGGGHGYQIFFRQSFPSRSIASSRGTQDDVQIVEFALERQKNKTGDILHVSVEGLLASGVLYGYRINGPQGWQQGHRFDDRVILLDPYAKLVSGRKYFGLEEDKPSQLFGTYDFDSSPFDRGDNYKLPNLPEIPHLLELGINAMELLPVFEFDELEFKRFPNPRDHMMCTHKMD